MSSTPAGWYPVGDNTVRWWDGDAWTAHTTDAPTQTAQDIDDLFTTTSPNTATRPAPAPAADPTPDTATTAHTPGFPTAVTEAQAAAQRQLTEQFALIPEVGPGQWISGTEIAGAPAVTGDGNNQYPTGGVLSKIGEFFGSRDVPVTAVVTAARNDRKRHSEPNLGADHSGLIGVIAAAVLVFAALGVLTYFGTSSGADQGGWAVAARYGALVIAPAAGFISLIIWQRYWRLLDTPTLDLAGLRPGTVEISGNLRPWRTSAFQSPIAGVPVLWAEVEIEREKLDSDKKSSWHTVFKQQFGSDDIAITDGTHRIGLHNWGSKFHRQIYQGTHRATGMDVNLGFKNLDLGIGGQRYRVTERAVLHNAQATLQGTVAHDGYELAVNEPAGRAKGTGDFGALGNETAARTSYKRRAAITSLIALGTAVWFSIVTVEQSPAPHIVLRPNAVGIGITVAVGLGLFAITSSSIRLHNRIVGAHQQALGSWAWITVEMSSRNAAIGNIVRTLRKAFNYEHATLVAATAARMDQHHVPDTNAASQVEPMAAQDHATTVALIALAEAHPQLRSDTNTQQLLDALVTHENRIAAARKYYNDAIAIQRRITTAFPGILMRSFTPAAGEYLNLGMEDVEPTTTNNGPS